MPSLDAADAEAFADYTYNYRQSAKRYVEPLPGHER